MPSGVLLAVESRLETDSEEVRENRPKAGAVLGIQFGGLGRRRARLWEGDRLWFPGRVWGFGLGPSMAKVAPCFRFQG